jgi:hypothetical protein
MRIIFSQNKFKKCKDQQFSQNCKQSKSDVTFQFFRWATYNKTCLTQKFVLKNLISAFTHGLLNCFSDNFLKYVLYVKNNFCSKLFSLELRTWRRNLQKLLFKHATCATSHRANNLDIFAVLKSFYNLNVWLYQLLWFHHKLHGHREICRKEPVLILWFM